MLQLETLKNTQFVESKIGLLRPIQEITWNLIKLIKSKESVFPVYKIKEITAEDANPPWLPKPIVILTPKFFLCISPLHKSALSS